MDNSTALATKDSFSVAFTNELNEKSAALPKDFNTAKFVQNAVALLNGNETLQKFVAENGTAQVKLGLMRGALLNLEFMNKECYLVPYGKQLNFMIDYRGAEKLAKKYSIRPIKEIYAKLVREGDEFEEKIVNGEPTIDFKPIPFNNNPIIGAFAVCLFKDGGMTYDTMNKAELDTCKSKSRSANGMAWKDFANEMYKKTVLHRLCKHIELDFDSIEQRQIFDEDVAIETDVKEQVKNEVELNANQTEFIIEQ